MNLLPTKALINYPSSVMTSLHVLASVFSLLLRLLFLSAGVGSGLARVAVATIASESLLSVFLVPLGEEDHLNNDLNVSNGEIRQRAA